ncbi:MAG TPA: hypothetical protein DEB25_06755, partial [Desulfobulbaceae bacterium]|nr:hypothetical protein [Desulfobulbaceae bacterium]
MADETVTNPGMEDSASNLTSTVEVSDGKAYVQGRPEEIEKFVREGQDLVIHFKDGQVVRVPAYFMDGDQERLHLVLVDGNTQLPGVAVESSIPFDDQTGADVLFDFGDKGGGIWGNAGLLGILGALAVGGVALAVANDDDDSNPAPPPSDSGISQGTDDGGGSGSRPSEGDRVSPPPVSPPPEAPAVTGAIDNIGPIQGDIRANGGITDDTTPTLSGTGKAGDTITVYDNGAKVGQTTVDQNGNWSVTPDKPLGNGDHSLTTTATDSTGKQSPASDPINIKVDTTVPDTIGSGTAISFDDVTDDNMLNASEAGGN